MHIPVQHDRVASALLGTFPTESRLHGPGEHDHDAEADQPLEHVSEHVPVPLPTALCISTHFAALPCQIF
jgi:hypothetical protein